jgi:septum formation topological specificity factor MinE
MAGAKASAEAKKAATMAALRANILIILNSFCKISKDKIVCMKLLNEEVPTTTTMLRENMRDAIKSFSRECERNILFLGTTNNS